MGDGGGGGFGAGTSPQGLDGEGYQTVRTVAVQRPGRDQAETRNTKDQASSK